MRCCLIFTKEVVRSDQPLGMTYDIEPAYGTESSDMSVITINAQLAYMLIVSGGPWIEFFKQHIVARDHEYQMLRSGFQIGVFRYGISVFRYVRWFK